ncbi:MAG: HTTM domain-containing protein [Steroidobacteraceae bacterium]
MNLDSALHWMELLAGWALLQQSLEHCRAQAALRWLFVPRLLLAALLILQIQTQWVIPALLLLGLIMLHRFAGPYNGGSDRMTLLVLICLCAARLAPPRWQEIALGYLALQVVLSYFIAGWVKLRNPEWRNGRALRDVFEFSAYPVSDGLRRWADQPQLLYLVSWAVMVFELLFPLALSSHTALLIALGIAASFHLANALLFGLNRFFWIWIATYPCLIWFQQRIMG